MAEELAYEKGKFMISIQSININIICYAKN